MTVEVQAQKLALGVDDALQFLPVPEWVQSPCRSSTQTPLTVGSGANLPGQRVFLRPSRPPKPGNQLAQGQRIKHPYGGDSILTDNYRTKVAEFTKLGKKGTDMPLCTNETSNS